MTHNKTVDGFHKRLTYKVMLVGAVAPLESCIVYYERKCSCGAKENK